MLPFDSPRKYLETTAGFLIFPGKIERIEAVAGSCTIKGIIKNFVKSAGKHLCQSLFFNKKETLAQVFSGKFSEIF